jgi:hypothetical protein
MFEVVCTFSPGQLPDAQKAQEYMKKFNKILADDARVCGILVKLVNPDCTCKKAEDYVVCIILQYYHY